MSLLFEIREQFQGQPLNLPIKEVVTELLLSVPPHHIRGLGFVLLTDSASLSRERKREKHTYAGKKKHVVDTPMLYHWAWQGQPAWIEVFVDHLNHEMPRYGWRIPIVREMVVGHGLYYFVGAHTFAVTPTAKPTKDEAPSYWRDRLLGAYLHRKYWYISPLINPIYARVGKIQRIKRNSSNAEAPGGKGAV